MAAAAEVASSKCQICEQMGHLANACKQPCELCQKPGHKSRNCVKAIKPALSSLQDEQTPGKDDIIDVLAVQFNLESETELKILKLSQFCNELATDFSTIVQTFSVSNDGAIFFVSRGEMNDEEYETAKKKLQASLNLLQVHSYTDCSQ